MIVMWESNYKSTRGFKLKNRGERPTAVAVMVQCSYQLASSLGV